MSRPILNAKFTTRSLLPTNFPPPPLYVCNTGVQLDTCILLSSCMCMFSVYLRSACVPSGPTWAVHVYLQRPCAQLHVYPEGPVWHSWVPLGSWHTGRVGDHVGDHTSKNAARHFHTITTWLLNALSRSPVLTGLPQALPLSPTSYTCPSEQVQVPPQFVSGNFYWLVPEVGGWGWHLHLPDGQVYKVGLVVLGWVRPPVH